MSLSYRGGKFLTCPCPGMDSTSEKLVATGNGASHCMSVPDLLGAGLAAGDEVEDRGAEVGEPLLADALAPQEGGWR